MKTVYSIILLFILCTTALAQSGWQHLFGGDYFQGPYFKDITFPSDQTGWVLSNYHLRKTTNSGADWIRYNIADSTDTLDCFYFLNANTGWVIEDEHVKYTSSGGASWTDLDTSITGARSVFFKDAFTGWISGQSGMLKKTTTGGTSWFSLVSGTSDNLNRIRFADGNFGVCAGDWGTILSTTNGGANWVRFADINLGFFSSVTFINSQSCIIGGTGNQIFRTTNMGLTWTSFMLNTGSYVNSVIFTSANTGFAFGKPQVVYKTTNSGESWFQVPGTGTFSAVYSAASSPSSHIWVTSDSGVVSGSVDLTANWSNSIRHFLTYEHLNSVHFADNSTGITCGANGTLLRTTSGGNNWTRINLNTNQSLTDVQMLNSLTGYLCGGYGNDTGIVLKTVDGGLSWQRVNLDTSSYNAIHFINTNTGWAAGREGRLTKTTNGGLSWIKYQHDAQSNINDVFFRDANTGFICKSIFVYKTTNGGQTIEPNSTFTAFSIQFTGSTGFFTRKLNNYLYVEKTTNLGTNWTSYLTGGPVRPFGTPGQLSFVNSETGWVVSGNIIRRTTNGGVNWTQQDSMKFLGLYSVYALNPDICWAVGHYGRILKTTSGGIGISQISSELPNEFYLSQNYPNPFNPVTKIRFAVTNQFGKGEPVTLKVYDILGRLITTLVNQYLDPGTYEAEWNASEFSSGIYFYSLLTGDFIQTRKMVLIK